VSAILFLSFSCEKKTSEEKSGKEKAVEVLRKIKEQPHQLEVKVNRNGLVKTMTIEAASELQDQSAKPPIAALGSTPNR
jgi:hypothetical protein